LALLTKIKTEMIDEKRIGLATNPSQKILMD